MYEEDESSVSKQSFATVKTNKHRQQHQKENSKKKSIEVKTVKPLLEVAHYDDNGNSENSIRTIDSKKDDERGDSRDSSAILNTTVSRSSSESLESESDEDSDSISSVGENNENDYDNKSETHKSTDTEKSVERKLKISETKANVRRNTKDTSVADDHKQRKAQKTLHRREKNQIRKRKTSHKTDGTDLVLEIHLIRVSNLKFKKYIRSPRIKISLYDIVTENQVKKSSSPSIRKTKIKNRQTVDEDKIDYIQPVTSEEGKIIETNRLCFVWNERILIDENFSYLENDNFIVFFEIIDAVKESSFGKFKKKITSNGWYNICWGYLKLTSNQELMTTILNAKFISLQLYKYKNLKKYKTVLEQWKSKKYSKYRGILDIKLSALKSNLSKLNEIKLNNERSTEGVTKYHVDRVDRSDKIDGGDYDDDGNGDGDVKNSNNRTLIENLIQFPNSSWDRIRKRFIKDEQEHQKLPERIVFNQRLLKGSSVCSFSPDDGKFLAYAETRSQQMAFIHVLEIPNFNLLYTLKGHTGIIHSLHWLELSSFVDKKDLSKFLLISTSEDRSCIVWNLNSSSYNIQHVLPHPSFVYSACFIYEQSNSFITIATGGRDFTIRFWNIDERSHNSMENKSSILFQESLNHNSYIVSVVYNTKLQTLYSAEVNGVVWEWNRRNENSKWEPIRKFEEFDSRINQIELIIVKNLLCILTDCVLYSIDLKTKFTKRLLLNTEIASSNSSSQFLSSTGIRRMCFSSRGTYAFITSEMNSDVSCWNLVTDNFLKILKLPNYQQMICWIEIRSDLNYLAISCYGKQQRRQEFEMGGIYVYGCTMDEENQNYGRRSLTANIGNGNDNDGDYDEKTSKSRKMKRRSCDFSLKNENFRTVLTKLDAIFKFAGCSHNDRNSDRMKDKFVEKEYEYRRDADDRKSNKKKSSSSSSASSGQQKNFKNVNWTYSVDSEDSNDDNENEVAGSSLNRTFVITKKFNDGTYNVLKESNCVLNNDTYSISSKESTDQTDISESLDDDEYKK